MEPEAPKPEPVAKPRGVSWATIKTVLFIGAVIAFFGFPVIQGYSVLPTSLNPGELGAFTGGLVRFWSEFLAGFLRGLIGG